MRGPTTLPTWAAGRPVPRPGPSCSFRLGGGPVRPAEPESSSFPRWWPQSWGGGPREGPADWEAVRALQGALTLEPYGTQTLAEGIPAPAAVPVELAFFEQLRTWMRAFPPSQADRAYQQRFAPLGLLDPASPYA